MNLDEIKQDAQTMLASNFDPAIDEHIKRWPQLVIELIAKVERLTEQLRLTIIDQANSDAEVERLERLLKKSYRHTAMFTAEAKRLQSDLKVERGRYEAAHKAYEAEIEFTRQERAKVERLEEDRDEAWRCLEAQAQSLVATQKKVERLEEKVKELEKYDCRKYPTGGGA
jgi:phosphoribosylaminoimidazole-succinocarboxamide synthase